MKRIEGEPGQPGRLEFQDADGDTWQVPCVTSRSRRTRRALAVAQNEYVNRDRDVEPGMVLRGDFNEMCQRFLDTELEP